MNVTHDNFKMMNKAHKKGKTHERNPVTVDIKDDMSQPVRGLPKGRA